MKARQVKAIALYIVILAVPAALYAVSSGFGDATYLFSGVAGIVSLVLLDFELLLVARCKFLDRAFGLDRLYRYHMYIAVVAIILAFIHKSIKEGMFRDSLQTSIGEDALNIFLAVAIFSILMMINKLFIKVKPVDYVRSLLNKTLKLKYQWKVLIHNLMVVGLIVLQVHVFLASSVSFNKALMVIVAVYFIVPFALYIKSRIYDVYFNARNRYVVSEIINESDGIVTVRFKPENGEVFHYMPGQFLYVRIKNPDIPGDEHPFTITSSPEEKGYVSITVKQLGDFSGSLKNLKTNDKAVITGAYGTFSYKYRSKSDKICFIAGGIGITPFLGMMRHMAANDAKNEVVLLWGARTMAEIICSDEIDKLGRYLNKFELIPVLSNDEDYIGEKGFIDKDKLSRYIQDLSEYDFYICGPPIMMEQQLINLKALGVSRSNIFYERFAM